MSQYVKTLQELSMRDTPIAGGKGASLGEMIQHGIPVPSGFVVLATTFNHFLKINGLETDVASILTRIDYKNTEQVDAASKEIQTLILNKEVPTEIVNEIQDTFKSLNAQYVAVRSSATAEDSTAAAWAGQLETYLNTTEEMLLTNVRKCWASLFTPRAIFYRFDKKLNATAISVAVVVQKMIASDVSGIAFSVHPVTQDPNQLIIEVVYGLGEAIVGGNVTPDSYVVNKKDGTVIQSTLNSQEKMLVGDDKGNTMWKNVPQEMKGKQILSSETVKKLAEVITNVEHHYGFPVDVEWAIQQNIIYITQSRPITTLTQVKESVNEDEDDELLNEIRSINWKQLVNRKETPLFTSLLSNSYQHFKEATGIDWKTDYYLRLQNGDLCFNIDDNVRLREIFINGGLTLLKEFSKSLIIYITKFDEIASEIERTDISRLSKQELQAYLEKFIKAAFMALNFFSSMPVADGSISQLILDLLPTKDEKIKQEWLGILTFPIQENVHADELRSFYNLVSHVNKENFNKLLKKHIDDFGWIGTRGYWWQNTWTKQDIQNRIDTYLEAGKNSIEDTKQLDELRVKTSKQRKTLEETLEISTDSLLYKYANLGQEFAYLRTWRADVAYRAGYKSRSLFYEIAKRAGLKNEDGMYFMFDEITQVLQSGKSPISQHELQNRKKAFIYIKLPNKFTIFTNAQLMKKINDIIKTDTQNDGQLKGEIAFPGVISGTVKIVRSGEDIGKVKKGDILVAAMTLPSYISAMQTAAAFVTDEGGILCHAAIVAREMSKPCIIGTKMATRILKDGDMIEVDANNGIVRVIK